MIDIHTHILPEVDDGSSSMEESLEMAHLAARGGTRYLVATPHCNIPGLYENYRSKYLTEVFLAFRSEIARAELPISLVYGMEIFATPELPDLFASRKVWTFNGKNYFLVEMAFDEDPGFLDYVLKPVCEMGYQPIIAHPERYYSVQDDPMIAYDWYRKGYGLQLNRGSLQGRFGRREMRTAHFLMEHRICTCVASDAHSSETRTPDLGAVRSQIEETYGSKAAALYLIENPKRILAGAPLLRPKPVDMD